MRITSGQFKGKILQSPPGLSTRPTSDRARQAVFNILSHAAWCGVSRLNDAPVIDIFAGTGALGLEALSRGASHCIFVEDAPAALASLRQNIAACRMAEHSQVMPQSVLKLAPRPATCAPRQLVFCDPPYNTASDTTRHLGMQAIAQLITGGWLAPDCLIVQEMAKALPEDIPAGCTLLDCRDYGVARLHFLRVNPSHA